MIIDTKDVSSWLLSHLLVVIPASTGVLSWLAAQRWQAALNANEGALVAFYFVATLASGLLTLLLAYNHLQRLGLVERFGCGCGRCR